MTPLEALLIRRIAATGPITVADYMADCLLHPEHGYYTTRQPFGAAGDFTTAPEISQMFGELIGLCLAQTWLDQGSPPHFTLAELGPGRGTLMADILRATRGIPGFHAAAKVTLLEASPALRETQRATLGAHPAQWLEDVTQLPQSPLFLIANEFFDALPIRQFTRDTAGWREHLVGLTDGRLSFGLSAAAPLAMLNHRLNDTEPGDIVEVCPAAPVIIEQIAQRIAAHGGAAILIDYGNWRSNGDTLQALRAHAFSPPLATPGHADLTAHVDFAALALAAAPCAVKFTDQGAFLTRLGLQARAQRLGQNLSGAALENHMAATRRLTDAAEMGTLFKVLALYPPSKAAPPGFA